MEEDDTLFDKTKHATNNTNKALIKKVGKALIISITAIIIFLVWDIFFKIMNERHRI